MSRISVILSSPRHLLGALLVALLAVGAVVGSGASFTSKSANPSNTFSAGNLAQSNSKEGVAVLTATKMVPGAPGTNGTVVITNSGDVAGTFTLSKTSLTDTPGANGGQLSGVLNLKVEDVTKAGSPISVYSGKVGAMGAQSLGSFAAGEARTYKFTVDFPDGGVPASATTGDNAYKGSSMSVGYQWDATS
jgi:spore coat-associated protein N